MAALGRPSSASGTALERIFFALAASDGLREELGFIHGVQPGYLRPRVPGSVGGPSAVRWTSDGRPSDVLLTSVITSGLIREWKTRYTKE